MQGPGHPDSEGEGHTIISVSQQIDTDSQPTKYGGQVHSNSQKHNNKKTCNFTYQGNTNYNLVDLQTFDNLEQVLGNV